MGGICARTYHGNPRAVRSGGGAERGGEMSGMLGMDPEEVRQHSAVVLRAEEELRSRLDELGGTISRRDSFWRGPDAERFSEEWAGAWDLGTAALEKLSWSREELERQAEEQDRASSAEGDGAGAAPLGGDQGIPAAFLPFIPGVAFDPGDGVTSNNDPAIKDAWAGMSDDEKKAVLRQVVEDELAAYGWDVDSMLPAYEVRFFPDWVNGGAISLSTGMIYLSDALLETPYGLQIAAHEARHQVQYEMIRRTDADPWDWITRDDNSDKYAQVEEEYGFTREEIEQWRHEFKPWNYEFPGEGEQMERYRAQQVEVDAREREHEFADEFTFEDLQQAQRDAGVPVSQP